MDINPSRPDAQQSGERPLNLSAFAQQNQITEDRVWELIEEGELAARFVNDEILILREQDAPAEPEIDFPAAPEISVQESAPVERSPVATKIPEPEWRADSEPRAESRAEPSARIPEPEPMDTHDPIPADDYRDLLVFAQDAMNRTMDLSRQLLATKDELLRMKDERIQQLVFDQQRHEHEIRRLRKKVEDLETLCRLTPNP